MRGWARAILVTALVAVLPVAIVWALWALGVVSSVWISAPLVIALVLLASFAGAAYWKRRPATGDVLFSDLLLWGWARRRRAERRLADAVELLGQVGAADEAEKLGLLKRVAIALDAKDPYLEGHSKRVARYSSLMAHRLRVTREEAIRIETAAVIHDVGKLHVPDEVLTKPGTLTPDETLIMRRHAAEGAELVACLGDPSLSDIVRHHHERFDGGGYPSGLRGASIPVQSRIIAVADAFEAMTGTRPYRDAIPVEDAIRELQTHAGTQFDVRCVDALVEVVNDAATEDELVGIAHGGHVAAPLMPRTQQLAAPATARS
jgi:putative nucleotidyltransferase with HDIG domain